MNELDSSAIIRDLEMLLDQLYYWAKRARESRSTSDDDGLGGRGRRKDGPFVAVNCAAMPEPLLESELFGHVRGAFTDARAARTGLFVQAHRGTLLLDEIGDLPLALQPKLLRALQERVVRPIGGNEEVPFDVHLVATTNRDLESAVEEGRFREDLYFRVNVIHVEMPPLRARGSDVLLLAQHFLVHHAGKAGKHVSALSPEAAERLLAYAWPGNVRELQNAMERAVALARYDQVTVDDLPEKVRAYRPSHVLIAADDPSELVPLEEAERRYILRERRREQDARRPGPRDRGERRSTESSCSTGHPASRADALRSACRNDQGPSPLAPPRPAHRARSGRHVTCTGVSWDANDARVSRTKPRTVDTGRTTDVRRPLMKRRLWHAANRPPQQGPGTVEEPSPVPPPSGARAGQEDVDWHAWFRNLGRQARTLRELLGLSQDRLARLAGVSQGSVSRFEKGIAQGTTAVVMFKLAVALARQSRAENHERLAELLVRVLDDIEGLVPVRAVRDLPMIARDPQAEQLQILFMAAPPRAREAVLSIVRAFCTIAGSHPRNVRSDPTHDRPTT